MNDRTPPTRALTIRYNIQQYLHIYTKPNMVETNVTNNGTQNNQRPSSVINELPFLLYLKSGHPTGKLDAAAPNLQSQLSPLRHTGRLRTLDDVPVKLRRDNHNARSERGITRATPSPMSMPHVGHVVDVSKTCPVASFQRPTVDS
jgi:hypothetical protein